MDVTLQAPLVVSTELFPSVDSSLVLAFVICQILFISSSFTPVYAKYMDLPPFAD